MQFWLLASYTLILGDISGPVALVGFRRGNELLTEAYLTIGVSIFVIVGVWLRRNLKADRGLGDDGLILSLDSGAATLSTASELPTSEDVSSWPIADFNRSHLNCYFKHAEGPVRVSVVGQGAPRIGARRALKHRPHVKAN